ncbi:MAG: hypothetical protein ACI8RZ_001022 [Myxococcota bacterium]|jgi:hypothetical protein
MRLYQIGLVALVLTACDDKAEVETPIEDPVEDTEDDTIEPAVDGDGDGYAVEVDCDDGNASIHPGQPEVCDGVDDNCNGQIDEGFSDTDTDGIADCTDTEECDGLDNNGDGVADEGFSDSDGDGTPDCLDPEECNGLDDDGDGLIDEDFDTDGDGYAPCATDGTADCDDSNADISPDATEVGGDAIDNDCDGAIDEGDWGEGDLVITEILNNPLSVSDRDGEWFEIRNNSGEDRILNGLTIHDDSGDEHRLAADDAIWLLDGAYMVLGINGDTATNGGVSVDYVYDEVSLSNESDSLMLSMDGLLIDGVTWDDGASMPDTSGSSMSLDILYLDASKNDVASNWCDTAWPDVSSAEVLSTPGESNRLCATVDHDNDGYAESEGDCDDEDITVGPGSDEIAYDGIDNDCDPTSPDDDLDGDGFFNNDDCDDNDAEVYPGNVEICDSIDNDCNGDIDDDDANVIGARSWYPDGDGDGYGDATSTAMISCDVISGLVEDNADCDDTDALYNPAAIEDDCDDLEDYNCDGQAAFVDEDLDGFSVCDNDCDDTDARVFPYGWENASDGIDNDCDGDTDTADSDTARLLSLTDDSYTAIALSTTFPFCSTDWTDAYVSSNGRITFGSGSTTYSYSSSTLASSTTIAGLWDDLNPSGGGRIAVMDYSDATGVYFLAVDEYGSSASVTFSMIMLDDGRVVLSYGDIGSNDGLVGWSCGSSSSATESDLTDEAADVPAGSLGIGQGTESNFFEMFTSSADANDLANQTFTFCVNSGADDDGDDWTDLCGDVNDADSSVMP